MNENDRREKDRLFTERFGIAPHDDAFAPTQGEGQ